MRLQVFSLLLTPLFGCALPSSAPADAPNPFASDFWSHWGDGRAEIATYDLTYPRYGELRSGSAVTIFVTETFSHEARVKADPGRHAASDEFPVMKLNLVQDFSTGIYDYNLMTSAFTALAPWAGRPAGSPAKVSFSSQEWCGHVWHQLIPDENRIRHTMHSYFDGEADLDEALDYPRDGFFEDALFHWARRLAAPFLDPGETRTVPFLRSAETSRMRHVPVGWRTAQLTRAAEVEKITVTAGTYETERLTAAVDGEPDWTFWVERKHPRRIVRWEREDGRRADLVASERMSYWELNANGNVSALERIGLSPRPSRTP